MTSSSRQRAQRMVGGVGRTKGRSRQAWKSLHRLSRSFDGSRAMPMPAEGTTPGPHCSKCVCTHGRQLQGCIQPLRVDSVDSDTLTLWSKPLYIIRIVHLTHTYVDQRRPADAYLQYFLMELILNPCECLCAVRSPPPYRNTRKHAPSPPRFSIYVSISRYLLSGFSCAYLDGKKKAPKGFSRGKVCCPVSREWERNPVFLGLVSLPVPRSHPWFRVTIRHRVRTRTGVRKLGLFSLSRIMGFWLNTAPVLCFKLSFLSFSCITVFLIIFFIFTSCFPSVRCHSHSFWYHFQPSEFKFEQPGLLM